GVYAGAAGLLADGAMTMMRGVPGALVGAARAGTHTGLEKTMDDEFIPVRWTCEDPGRDLAQIRAGHAEGDARGHPGYVRLREIRVHARRARLKTLQARVDGRGQLGKAERQFGRRDIQHVSRRGHGSTSST